MPSLLLSVEFFGPRYHGLEPDGRPEWPPSPARLFQALVAGAARGAVLAPEDRDALAWLERLDAPLIAAPPRHKGQSFRHFMPNNDLDTKGGDPARISEIRSATKRFHPQIFDGDTPFLYLWTFDYGRVHAERMKAIASRLYQLGRGVDMAWAVAEILEEKQAGDRLGTYPGTVHHPTRDGGGSQLACPSDGSLKSLVGRYAKARARFRSIVEAAPTRKDHARKKMVGQTFAQPPKPKFHTVFYDSPPVRLLYELRDMAKDGGFVVWTLKEVVRLVETVRNGAAERLAESLKQTFPDKAAAVERVFGLCRDATEADKVCRIRIIPLPSIGHPHADHGVRRLLVEIPPDCPLAVKDIEWAISATGSIDRDTGEVHWMLVPGEEWKIPNHYGIYDSAEENARTGFREWRTVTPMALPTSRPHGRKRGSERAAVERDTAMAVVQALRHAGITSEPVSIRVQREPFEGKGARAEAFAYGERFSADRLHHVEIIFAEPTPGPVVIGDGRYLGLGLMRPVPVKSGQ